MDLCNALRVALPSGLLALVCSITVVPSVAHASPWTLRQGEVALKLSTDVQFADREFVIERDLQRFPLDGRFWGGNFRTDLRYGISDRLEIGGSLAFAYASYSSDEVFFGEGTIDTSQTAGTAQSVRANILSFDQTAVGLGDLRLFVRSRLTPMGRAVVATEVGAKIPTGYRQPSGTFEDDSPAEGLTDDVTLGDGQMDLHAMLLTGFSPTWDWFIRLDVGGRARFFGPAPQVIGAFKTGYRVTPGFLPYIFVDGQISVGEGRVIGQSFIANDPAISALDFEFSDVAQVDLTLDRSTVVPGIGAIFALGDRDIDINYSYVVWGENTAQLHMFSVGTNLKF
jgi:hypothetical protein